MKGEIEIKVKDGKFVGKYWTQWDGDFDCAHNKLTSLKGAPKKVGGNFFCSDNILASLDGAPKKVDGGFYCYGNKLTSLKGAPIEIGDNFYCHNNSLTSIQNINQHVKKIDGTFVADAGVTGLISLLLIDHPPMYISVGAPSVIFNHALAKIHSGQDRMEAIMEVILNTPEEYAWRLGDIE